MRVLSPKYTLGDIYDHGTFPAVAWQHGRRWFHGLIK